jgi:molybdopterin converting factor small subunit
MKIEVLFFAQLKEAVGCESKSLEVADGATVEGCIAAIREWPEWSAVSQLPLTYAVNERIVDGRHPLSEGDRLALLTPISGG